MNFSTGNGTDHINTGETHVLDGTGGIQYPEEKKKNTKFFNASIVSPTKIMDDMIPESSDQMNQTLVQHPQTNPLSMRQQPTIN